MKLFLVTDCAIDTSKLRMLLCDIIKFAKVGLPSEPLLLSQVNITVKFFVCFYTSGLNFKSLSPPCQKLWLDKSSLFAFRVVPMT